MGGKLTETVVADDAGIERAAAILCAGGLVAVPTETVYGLAARADRDEAVAGIYRAKGRPDFNPLIVHVLGQAEAAALADFGHPASLVMDACWPGPLTLVLPRRPDAPLAPAVTAGLSTVAVRAPAHPVMRSLLQRTGLPLAAPSANRSQGISPTRAEHVEASLSGRIDLILDAGASECGLESTILAIREDGRWEVLRPGPIDADALHRRHFDKPLTSAPGSGSIEAPGQMARHYSPGKPMRLGAREARDDEFIIGFGQVTGDCSLSAGGDLALAAARLYACLHEAAASARPRIAVAPVPDEGIGRAINDRLRRAAA
ncbi:MAG TPA: L-threonylcarbamoyladenylate synthase [Croceibacterium sp.]|nr:L-threonylcarbamoyladenylate synthase [Croceibacterium sp.]